MISFFYQMSWYTPSFLGHTRDIHYTFETNNEQQKANNGEKKKTNQPSKKKKNRKQTIRNKTNTKTKAKTETEADICETKA